MARPQKDGLDYFPHDTDAVNDEKIEALRALYGNDGYAFFFILLERIYRSPNTEIDISDAETIQILARKVAVTVQKFTEMMETALKWRCFDPPKYKNHHILTSKGIKKRASPVLEKRANSKLKYDKDRISTPVSDAETTTEMHQRKEKKRKEKKRKEKYGEFSNVLLSFSEHQKLGERFGQATTEMWIEKLSCWLESTGKQRESHYATILTWDRRDKKEEEQRGKVGRPSGQIQTGRKIDTYADKPLPGLPDPNKILPGEGSRVIDPNTEPGLRGI